MVGQMNTARRSVTAPLIAAALALALIAGGALWLRAGRGAEPGPLAGSGIGGPFTLIDQDGHRVSDRDFAGRYRLIYFGYTFCPDVCPTDLARNAAALRLLGDRAARVRPIFITIDPERDTPALLKQYVSNFPGLTGLTGAPADVRGTAAKWKVYAARRGTGDGLSDGSHRAHLPDGPRGRADRLFHQRSAARRCCSRSAPLCPLSASGRPCRWRG